MILKKILLLFTLFFCLTFDFSAQEFQIIARILDADEQENFDTKKFTLVYKGLDGDSLIFSQIDSISLFSRNFFLNYGKYALNIKNELSQKLEIQFIVDEQTPLILNLGSHVLKDDIAEIEEVTITGIPKKFITVDAEKTVVLIENNPFLAANTIYNAIIKIPGIIPNPGGGFNFSGQATIVFFEGIPSSLASSDLDILLKSLPATSVKKIELITNPGASYDANFSGAIIDIISNDKAFKWISGSVSFNVGINRNLKMMPTFLLNGKAKKFTWNFQSSYSSQKSDFSSDAQRSFFFGDSTEGFYSIRNEKYSNLYLSNRGNVVTKLTTKSTLQVNAGLNIHANTNDGNSENQSLSSFVKPFSSEFNSISKGFSIDAGIKYRMKLDTFDRKIEISSNFSNSKYEGKRTINEKSDFSLFSLIKSNSNSNRLVNRIDLELPFKNKRNQVNFGFKLSNHNALNVGSYRFNDSILIPWDQVNFPSTIPYNYTEQNFAFYSEYKKTIKKVFSFTLGLRGEDFSFKGKVLENVLTSQQFFNLYPSIHTLYRITPDILFMLNYSRKINLPGYGMYDPNLKGYYDSYTSNTGNNDLEPNFLHRSHAKISIFEYCQLSFTHVYSNSINYSEVEVDTTNLAVVYSFKTYKNVQSLSGYFSLPVPFGLFKEGFSFFQKEIHVDEISFMYLYTSWDKDLISGYDYRKKNQAIWSFGVYSQFILPYKIRLNIDYNFSAKGTESISYNLRDIHELEFVLSKEFLNETWRASISFEDALNQRRYSTRTDFNGVAIQWQNSSDSQILWLKLAYSFGKYERPSLKEDAIPVGKVN